MRFRLYPTQMQTVGLALHCAHARAVWNAALEQRHGWRSRGTPAPGFAEQCRQLSEARHEIDWLGAGSIIVQQQALRDFDQAMRNFFRGTHRFPRWRKRGQDEGFRIVHVAPGHVRRLSRHWGHAHVPRVGWVRFRWSRDPSVPKSYRVTRDPADRWHIAFAIKPESIPGPGTGEVVGIDRGVVATIATSDGELLSCRDLRPKEAERLRRLQRCLAKTRRGSNRRHRLKRSIARLRAREVVRRKDFVEQATTRLARRYDVLKIEALDVCAMTRSAKGSADAPGRNVRAKAGLNRAILAQGWGLFVRRLQDKAPSRVRFVDPRHTSQRCSECGHTGADNRKSQAVFQCQACGSELHADVNAARNIAGGHPVTARGAWISKRRATNREPLRACA